MQQTCCIMQRLPLSSRLRCASVCSSWHKAAVAATDSIGNVRSYRHDCADADTIEGMNVWLQQHGSRITSLILQQEHLQLKPSPCSKLRELVV